MFLRGAYCRMDVYEKPTGKSRWLLGISPFRELLAGHKSQGSLLHIGEHTVEQQEPTGTEPYSREILRGPVEGGREVIQHGDHAVLAGAVGTFWNGAACFVCSITACVSR